MASPHIVTAVPYIFGAEFEEMAPVVQKYVLEGMSAWTKQDDAYPSLDGEIDLGGRRADAWLWYGQWAHHWQNTLCLKVSQPTSAEFGDDKHFVYDVVVVSKTCLCLKTVEGGGGGGVGVLFYLKT